MYYVILKDCFCLYLLKMFYYTHINEISRNIDARKCVFSFCVYFHSKQLFFNIVKHIFRFFTCLLPIYFLLNTAITQNIRESLSNCNVKKNVYDKQKIQVCFYKYRIYCHFVVCKYSYFTNG
jgi:hypothetical protein